MNRRNIRLTTTLLSLAALSCATAVNAQPCKDTNTSPASDATQKESTTLATQLRRQLDEKGWRAFPAGDGSVYYLPPTPMTHSTEKKEPPPLAQKRSLADQLREELESKGWIATKADDGSVYYLPPPVQQQITPPPRQPDTVTAAASQLHNELRSLGWRAVPADDGGVYYLPPATQSATQPATPPEIKAETAHPPVTSSGAIGTAADVSPVAEPPMATETAATPDAKPAAPKAAEKQTASPQAVIPQAPAEETSVKEEPPEAIGEGKAAAADTAEDSAVEPMATSVQRYRQPPRHPYGWSPYGHPGYMPAYPPQPQWHPRYRPAPPWYSQPR